MLSSGRHVDFLRIRWNGEECDIIGSYGKIVMCLILVTLARLGNHLHTQGGYGFDDKIPDQVNL